MIFDSLKAYSAIIAAGVLAVALVITGLMLAKERIEHASTVHEFALAKVGWANERVVAATNLANATTKARETEQQLTAQAAQTEATKNEQINALTGRAAALLVRVRNAEGSAATSKLLPGATAIAANAEAQSGDNFSGFPERVGSDLVSLASRAEAVRLQLASCEKQYDAARVALGGVALRGAR